MVVRLGRLHIYPFASKEYLTTYGTPADVADMVHHRLVNQVAPQLDEKAWGRVLGIERLDQIVSISTNASCPVQPCARREVPASRVESAMKLVERIEVFLRSGRPQLELSVGGQLQAEVLLDNIAKLFQLSITPDQWISNMNKAIGS